MGRPPIGKTAMTPAERKRRERTKLRVSIEQTQPLGVAVTTDRNDNNIKEAFAHMAAIVKEKEINILLQEAQPTSGIERYPHDAEKRRVEAIKQLRALHQVLPVRDRIRDFFDKEWAHILRAPDPAAAAAEFFNGKPRRGRPPLSEEQNIQIACAVQTYIDAGMTVEKACEAARLQNAPEIGTWERIRDIYYGPAVDKQTKKGWQLTIGARQVTVPELLSALEPCVRAVLSCTDSDPELWLDFLINRPDLI